MKLKLNKIIKLNSTGVLFLQSQAFKIQAIFNIYNKVHDICLHEWIAILTFLGLVFTYRFSFLVDYE